MANESLYARSDHTRLAETAKLVPEMFSGFRAFDKAVFESGTLPLKVKELIAIAVAHATDCPWCIEAHVQRAKKAGASREEVMEAVMVASALRAGAAVAHSINSLVAYDL